MTHLPKTVAAVIVAAGRGTRAGAGIPKQWRPLAGLRVADWAIKAFTNHQQIDHVVAVVHPDDTEFTQSLDVETVSGGASRDQSVRAGLEALAGRGFDTVLIHDVARAGVSAEIITNVIAALGQSAGAAPALAVTDALWRGQTGTVSGTQDREGLFRAQTPQGFRFEDILSAHRTHAGGAADDVEVARAAGLDVAIVAGNEANLKITTPGDFARMERILRGQMDIRLGNGFDVHAFEDGDHVVLCGVRVPHTHGLKGHSDADVGMHAVTDAIYGALAEGDIGRHFPPSEAEWKDADSAHFLDHAVKLATQKGFAISNVDCTLICERPKIGPHAAAMMQRMSEIMGLDADRISVKATTSERLGFTGREEGIAAIATATLVKS
ncbi:bifunctional 2-C-methyl-D-erythritol 4-phosphate cytidylyltransferase/2-C-methyl-D-erythritol 2,4-cyclodiphosphate synthase [Shimia thalassica]|uniref:bifunctional 2-C-methyl-D-erythritol 4-phosphate cytidylyltransferase/2-C-methyl-D-erythritol 2,4-cyclodiphosphate synthase n=1 Tax=Shimia thalassica TaxID=1715693 RepID=UPI001C095D74|nr:bifunctional 2-C-methyl-D-erythritol 4-phosphate cytidylyltransferase/2-C-methyl-D-erythritol 2,4-cyclodiphosphate synthase [Shimia thalassica]MBU2942013.1 bifunctional 2-C-methyl-D-erythritol 4-phosphate cytidylyltransferase/2-C-methyl-D-erythritol 2,4-cyclodiphosphate synthase [Shimia thalassica]MDO6503018.1 bifunctional 2-C-methyl-D-erythritol 4-phosphate cytidylyltransferase/2-C-methyl-D-erythritol 2,4-cyclodiphosphate synthase [Shimia thalassica]